MTDIPQSSGADLARQALAAYKASAKNTPAPAAKKTRRTMRVHRGEHRDPQGLATILGKLTAEQGWDTGLDGGNLIDQWATIAPTELATTVQPVAYDPERGILELRPSSPAYATQLRLFQQQLAKHLNTQLGRPAVRSIRVLAPGAQPTPTAAADTADTEQPAPGPVKTRDTASAGYQDALALVLEHKTPRAVLDPYVEQAMRRQEAALRAGRQPETEHQDAVWTQRDAEEKAGPAAGSIEESIARARAYTRQNRAGQTPRRAFDVA